MIKFHCVRLFVVLFSFATIADAAPIDVGSRLEPIVDDYLIERLDGAALRLHHPVPREIVLKFDKPWEGPFSGYVTVLKDGDRYRMYYRGWPKITHKPLEDGVTCYAESADGIHWTKPDLGLFEVDGTKQNNVIMTRHTACHNFAPMLDTNPDAPPQQRYKALGRLVSPQQALVAFVSPDGVHWKPLREEPVLARKESDKRYFFDSQNVSFWSESEGCYVCYPRLFVDGIRWIARSTSKDYVNWTYPVQLSTDGKPMQHLYTSQLVPYLRSPHVCLGFSSRFMQGRRALDKKQLEAAGTFKKFHNDCSDITLISTRGGDELKRTFLEAYIRPGLGLRNWSSRANYAAQGIVQTGPEELSIYAWHHCGYPTAHVRRYTLRPDGFASVNAPYSGGEMVTKPIRFSGDRLSINYSTSAAGGIRVEIQDAAGRPIPGFTLDDCPEIIGDQIERTVTWKQGSDVGSLAGRPVRIRFALKDADLFAFRFIEKADDEPAEFLRLCDANAKIVEKQIDLPVPPPRPFRGFRDSYTVRALAVAYDLTGDRKYLKTCKQWSDRMIRDQKGMLDKGAYYMYYGRQPGEDKGKWYVADCSSIALGVLATAVRCNDPKEKAKYLDSVKAFFRLVAENWVRPSGGIANGHWPESDDEFWCATGIFGSLAFCLYKETGEEEYLRIGRGTIDWLNRQDLLTVANDFYPEETIKPTVMMYCLEAYSAGLPHLESGSPRYKAALNQLSKAHRWMLKNMRLSDDKAYLSQWGSKHGGLPFHLYAFAGQVPGNEALVAAADRELSHIREVIKTSPPDALFGIAQLTDFALISYAERIQPGGIYRTGKQLQQIADH